MDEATVQRLEWMADMAERHEQMVIRMAAYEEIRQATLTVHRDTERAAAGEEGVTIDWTPVEAALAAFDRLDKPGYRYIPPEASNDPRTLGP